MATHRKFFPVARMPWHSDDHKFGESVEGLAVEEMDVINIFQPPLFGSLAIVDSGRCHVCGDWADYVFRGKLYCAICWLAWDEDFGG